MSRRQVTLTVHEVSTTAETLTRRPVPRRHIATAHEPPTPLADSTRIRAELGWRPQTSLSEIIPTSHHI